MASSLPSYPTTFRFPATASETDSNMTSELEPCIPPPLPVFSFNPGNLLSPSSTIFSTSPRPTGGHRRHPSGLNGCEGPPSPSRVSLGADQSDDPRSSTSSLPKSGPGRRGHAHRRSAAISSMDLTSIRKPLPTNPLSGSAPVTPSELYPTESFHPDSPPPMPELPIAMCQGPITPTLPNSPPDTPMSSRTKVDFVEPIAKKPRPESTISTDTSSTLSTVRPNHSRVNSAAPSSCAASPPSPLSSVRPKTADAALHLTSKEREWAGQSPSTSPRQSLHPFRNPFEITDTTRYPEPTLALEDGLISGSSGSSLVDEYASDASRSGAESLPDKLESAKQKPPKKKQHKVRNWAGSIFPLKPKRPRAKKPRSRRSPTPPPIILPANSEAVPMDNVDFDEDNTVIIRTPTNPDAPRPASTTESRFDISFQNAWKPRSFYEQRIDDSFSPVIDLDAALGPFNTPDMSSNHVAGSAFSIASRRMYSGGRRGEFVGPEMRYHRRAESAPEMPPFDRSALGGNRSSGLSTIAHADVFYEEEEDAFLAENQSPRSGQEKAAQPLEERLTVMDDSYYLESSSNDTASTIRQDTTTGAATSVSGGLGIQVLHPASLNPEPTTYGPGDPIDPVSEDESIDPLQLLPPKKSVEIVDHDEWHSPRPPTSSNANDSPYLGAIEKRPSTSPMDYAYSLPHLALPTHAPPLSSAFPSPDPSYLSFDGPRSATASSMTDHTSYHNFPDMSHASAEDVPSLTSSSSTTTTNKHRFPGNLYNRYSGERSSSFSAAVPRRSSHANSTKRSSLVSLSRLVSTSYGEKSKLSYEEKPPSDDGTRTKKANRLSRLVYFWKTKDRQKH